MFDFEISDDLKFILKKLAQRDKKRAEIIHKKMHEIINCDANSIMHYKNLRNSLKGYRRVHIDSSFVLTFKVDLKNNFILFVDFDHHDRIY